MHDGDQKKNQADDKGKRFLSHEIFASERG
jgi:hypothetical protein